MGIPAFAPWKSGISFQNHPKSINITRKHHAPFRAHPVGRVFFAFRACTPNGSTPMSHHSRSVNHNGGLLIIFNWLNAISQAMGTASLAWSEITDTGAWALEVFAPTISVPTHTTWSKVDRSTGWKMLSRWLRNAHLTLHSFFSKTFGSPKDSTEQPTCRGKKYHGHRQQDLKNIWVVVTLACIIHQSCDNNCTISNGEGCTKKADHGSNWQNRRWKNVAAYEHMWTMDYGLSSSCIFFAVVHPGHLVMVVGNRGTYLEWMQHLSKRPYSIVWPENIV